MPASYCPTWLTSIQLDMLRSYGCIDRTLLWSFNTTDVLASFCYLFVPHALYCIKLYILKIRIFVEILA